MSKLGQAMHLKTFYLLCKLSSVKFQVAGTHISKGFYFAFGDKSSFSSAHFIEATLYRSKSYNFWVEIVLFWLKQGGKVKSRKYISVKCGDLGAVSLEV